MSYIPDYRGRSAARLAAVQALYQLEMRGETVPKLLTEFHNHRLGQGILPPMSPSSTTWSLASLRVRPSWMN